MNTYGSDEQVTGFLTRIQDQIDTPEAFVLGTAVTLVAIDLDDENRLSAVCAKGRSKIRLPHFELDRAKLPKALKPWVAAYRRWLHGR